MDGQALESMCQISNSTFQLIPPFFLIILFGFKVSYTVDIMYFTILCTFGTYVIPFFLL